MTHPTSDPGESNPTADADLVGPDLRELFQMTAPTDPSSAEWKRVRLEAADKLPRSGVAWRVAGLAAAASILLAAGAIVLLSGDKRGGPDLASAAGISAQEAESPTVLPVADDDDVEIETVRGGAWRVAVGEKPVAEVIDWAGPRDVWPWWSMPDDLFGFEPLMSGGFQDIPVFWPADSQR